MENLIVPSKKAMKKTLVLKQQVLDAFQQLGMHEGIAVMVHTSLSSIGYVCGGAQTIIEALIETVGLSGTVMMPTQSWKNLDPEVGVHPEVDETDWQTLRDCWPPYDKQLTPTQTMGTVAEMFRSWPGTLRSDHPARSVAAHGCHARYLTEHHDLQNIFGDGSPIGRLYALDGFVLLIGVDYNKNTSLHLADARANYPSKHLTTEHSAVVEDGHRLWKAYETLHVDGEDFIQIGRAFERCHPVRQVRLGNATLRLMRQRELVDFAVGWIERNRK